MIRQPIVAVLGHVDHGKTTLLDKIRGTAVAAHEAGAITQHVGASELSIDIIKKVCKPVLNKIKIDIKIPGLLFIDTPGHEAFTSLRERGGSIADIALLIIDLTQGVQPQTVESIKILKAYKTPFIVVANKVDVLHGWHKTKTYSITESLNNQSQNIKETLDLKLYEIVGRLVEYGFDSERFDMVTDFTKQIMIIPASARTGEGIAEILVYLTGVSQKYLEDTLKIKVKGQGKASILEVKNEKGLGMTVDIILYDGKLKKSDEVMFGSVNGPKKTKVRAIMKPRLPGEKGEGRYKYIDEIYAASGAKLFAPGLEGALSGSVLMVVTKENEHEVSTIILKQVNSILFESESTGVIVKTDTLGSAEAIIKILKDKKIPVRTVAIGTINKKDLMNAQIVKENNKYLGAVLGFNVKVSDEIKDNEQIPIITSSVIYEIIEKYEDWRSTEKRKDIEQMTKLIPWPASMKILPGHVFRDCKPCIIGVELLSGKIRPGIKIISETGELLGHLKKIQAHNESIPEAVKGMKVAISIDNAVFSKQLAEKMKLYPYINKHMSDILLKKAGKEIEDDEKQVLKEIVEKTKSKQEQIS